ncbi:YoaK family protein [Granulicella sp. L46]|uniref:YoaK family protein n=1 Tax=Granulicella sp. L46 TaxID=1641865 RepID=UPI00131DE99C|nr:YoaK family protein [Granulicella sp. L46]
MPNSQTNSSTAEHQVAGSLLSAILLAITGGSLDAFIYLNHGHVFAAAMTGNGVLLGVAILHHDYAQALRHLLPIFGFITGIFFANLLDKSLKHHAVTVGLICEISALFVASFLPGHFPDLAFVPIISIVAAYQITSFRQVDTYAYNSTFITSNLRTAVDGLYDALTPAKRKAGLRKFRELSCIVLAFLGGAIAGAILSSHLYNHTLWLIDLPLVAVLLLTLFRLHSTSAR